ncbi:MAG: FmdB family zinc ribbon protein [Actinomycetes bacterium]
MPTYEYVCTKCGHQFEIVQSFSDDALTKCPECKGKLRKVFGSVGIVFKGSGFYKNDSRGSSSSVTPSTTKSDTTDASPTKAAESSTTAPAPSAPATPTPSAD